MKTIANRYQILEELGSGGISTVYKVRDTESGRTLALKRVEPSRNSEEELHRFAREFRFLSRIDHPNIVKVYETGRDGSLPFFTMEYLEGKTLADLLTEPDRGYALALKRDPTTLRNFLGQVCRALSFIHEEGTVHRDIKPSNLMIHGDGPTSSVKVLDLGLAKFRDVEPGPATQSAQILGTVHYSAPEQIRNLNVDGRADLYSLGAILYEIMTGRRPFGGDSAVSVAMQHLNELPVPPRVHDLDVPHYIQLIVMKLLEKDPDRRYRSPEDLMIDFNDPDVVDEIDDATIAAPPLLLHPRFLGRREPSARARTVMTELRAGTGSVLPISGDPGIGKTRFLNELCADAKVMGLQVLSGTCYRDAQTPYLPIISAIRNGLGERSLWNWVDKDDRFPLARLFPELRDEAVQAIPDEHQQVDQKRIVGALVDLLEAASRNSPIILCIDDLQWADEPSLAVLDALSGKVGDIPVAILVGHRPFETEPPAFLPEKSGVQLSPLPRDVTRDLIGSVLGSLDVQEELLAEVYGVSDGNPFSVIESIRSLEELGVLRWKRNQWNYTGIGQDLPERIEWQVNQRIARLSGRRREILEWACVLGRPFTHTLIEAADFGDEIEVHTDLTWLARNNILRLTGPDTYDLFHARISEAVMAAIPEDRLIACHRSVGEALLQMSSKDPDEISRHLIKGGEIERAVPYLLKAGEEHLRRCSFQAGLDLLATISDKQISKLAASDQANLCLQASQLNFFAGNPREAVEVLRRVDDLPIPERQRIDLKAQEFSILPVGDISDAEVRRCLRRARDLEKHETALKCVRRLIRLAWDRHDEKELESLQSQAVDICTELGTPFYQGYRHFLIANLFLESFDLRESKQNFQQAYAIFREVGHPYYATASVAKLIETCYYRGEFGEARNIRSEALALVIPEVTGRIWYHFAHISRAEGDLSTAWNEIQEATKLGGHLGSAGCQIYGLAALIAVSHGQRERYTELLSTSKRFLEDYKTKRPAVLRYEGESHLLNGNTAAAVECFEEAKKASGRDTKQQTFSSLPLARAYAVQGRTEEAISLLKEAQAFFKRSEAFHLEQLAATALEELRPASEHQTPGSQPTTEGQPMNYEDQTALLDEIVYNLVQATSAERAILAIYEDPNGEPALFKASGLGSQEIEDISTSILKQAILTDTEIISHDATSDPRFSQTQSVVKNSIRSVVCVPVPTTESLRAGLYIDHGGIDYFQQSAIDQIRSLAKIAGLAIGRSYKYDQLRTNLSGQSSRYAGIVGNSPKMQQVFDLMDKLAVADFPVLITGETGTGKGMVARAIHAESSRKDAPFVAQNCGAMNLQLLETELFGHAKGAFTGADYERVGLFEAAHAGSIFLDEIGDAPPEVQIRLLQAIEEGTIRRVGENVSREVDVRIIAATNKDLDEEVAAGRFREDLLFRLRVVSLPVPALRERKEDIPTLAYHFLMTESARMGWESKGFDESVLKLFESYPWPGNVRELENEVRRGITLAGKGKPIQVHHVSDALHNAASSIELPESGSFKDAMASLEAKVIRKALLQNDWNVTKTSNILGLSRVGLQRKLKRLGIERPRN